MLKVKLDIQLFGPGGGARTFTAGVTESAIRAAYDDFHNQIVAVNEAIGNIGPVRNALEAGWSGQDCQDYLAKFDAHQQNVQKQILEYDVAVSKAVEKLIEEWRAFQAGLIS